MRFANNLVRKNSKTVAEARATSASKTHIAFGTSAKWEEYKTHTILDITHLLLTFGWFRKTEVLK